MMLSLLEEKGVQACLLVLGFLVGGLPLVKWDPTIWGQKVLLVSVTYLPAPGRNWLAQPPQIPWPSLPEVWLPQAARISFRLFRAALGVVPDTPLGKPLLPE